MAIGTPPIKRRIHCYYNATSRWCEANNIPYQRDGYMFDSEATEVYDQIRNLTLYPIHAGDHWNYNSEKLGTYLKIGDPLIVHYQQGYLRAEVAKITSHKNIHVLRWEVFPIWNFNGHDAVHQGYSLKNLQQPGEWYTSGGHYGHSDTPEPIDQMYLHPRRHQIIKPRDKNTRLWRLQTYDLYAIPKERFLTLKLLEGT